MTNENGNDNPPNDGNLNELLDIKVEELDETALREKLTEIIPKYKETHQSNKQLFERAKSAEGGLKELKEKLKTFEEKPKEPEKVAPEVKTGELDEAQLDFFELKGYSDDEVEVFSSLMKKTGMSHRDVIKDEYALAKIQSIRDKKALQDAIPSSSKRGGSVASDDVGYWKQKVDSGAVNLKDVPFNMRQQIVDAREREQSDNVPPWQR